MGGVAIFGSLSPHVCALLRFMRSIQFALKYYF